MTEGGRTLLGPVREFVSVGLGKWASVVTRRKRPKAARKTRSSKQKSPLSIQELHRALESPRLFTSSVMGHLGGGDKAGMGDHDHAVAKTVENLAVAGNDDPGQRQETEAWTAGGIPFQ
ncbi:MAG: hypothetical protein GF309_11545 [Candidatus Lokiarchaeota archaeon]|nr:hypothetical protein [Candidatus Lokiarchaeota archaeon]